MPAHLQKYRKDELTKDGHTTPLRPPGEHAAAPITKKAEAPAAPRATIYALDRQTYRFAIREADVWDRVLDVLLRNYSLTIVDRQAGIVSTEWDSFFLNSAVYRNKLSLRLAKSGNGQTDVTIHNSVERLRDASQAAGAVGAVWLPAEDPSNEPVRIVQNLAILLNQPPPVLPPNMPLAKREAAPEEPVTR